MPISSTMFVRTTVVSLLVGLLALLVIVGATLWLGERTQGYFNQVIEARALRSAVVDLRNVVQMAETSQRGFLLTDDEKYLAPYNYAQAEIIPAFTLLREKLIAYPRAAQPLSQLEAALTAKFAEMAQTIELTRSGQRDAALAIIANDSGRTFMEQADTFFVTFTETADTLLAEGIADQRSSASALRWVTLAGAVVIIAFVAGSALTVVRYTGELNHARTEVVAFANSLEDRVRERTDDLGRANDEIQRFAYIVTHDLRAPLVNVMGFTSELEASLAALQTYMATIEGDDADPVLKEAMLAANEDLPEAIRFIRSSTRKMDGLINAILKLSREGRRVLKPETVNLKDVLEASSASIHHQISEGGGEIAIDVASPKLVTDKMSIEQVFGNLLDNAVKYRQKDRPLRIAVRAKQIAGNRLMIEVEDNGRGIAAQDHERVFELFRRSGSQDQTGEGIGLAHVRSVVRNLGGDITLASQFGQGTTFKISLPRDLRTIIRSPAV